MPEPWPDLGFARRYFKIYRWECHSAALTTGAPGTCLVFYYTVPTNCKPCFYCFARCRHYGVEKEPPATSSIYGGQFAPAPPPQMVSFD